MRDLVLHYEGQPLTTSVTAGPIRRVILDYARDCADSFRVWSVPRDGAMTPATDITEQFAETWGMEYRAGDLIPAFVLLHVPDLLPSPLRRSA